MRNSGTGRVSRPVPIVSAAGIAAALLAAAAPLAASPAAAASAAAAPAAVRSDGIEDFYRARANRPLWLTPHSGAAAQRLIGLLGDASVDGLDPGRYDVAGLRSALAKAWSGDPKAIDRAEKLLSKAFVSYARQIRRAPGGIIYVNRELAPAPPSARYLLDAAASAPSLESYVADIGWMNPAYGQLRKALLDGPADAGRRSILALNLERARALPASESRYVVVNAAAQRLYMYDKGEMVDTMRVVVGKPKYPTPMMNAFISAAALNPYWNVPPDLAAERIAPNVLKQGAGYLRSLGYEVLSDWTDSATVVDPSTVDWQAVADGKTEVRIRQLPGSHNALGKMKFVFPNAQGIFLHDTPEKQLLTEASRLYSGGCIRLEDAGRFGRWLFGRELHKQGDDPEQVVRMAELVPLYVTYLTAVPEGSEITYFDDVYGRDAARLAASGATTAASR